MMLPLGCDTTESGGREGFADHEAALELSPSQDLVDDPDIVAFEAVDSFDIEADVQALGSGCTLLRPAAWSGNGTTCVEYYHNPALPPDTLPMYDSQSFITESTYLGTGSARITCTDGVITIQKLSCYSDGSPF
jgi:hypothetical protein